MLEKTKIVEIDGTRYQLRRMAPDVGSFILMRMIAAGVAAAEGSGDGGQKRGKATPKPEVDRKKPTGEELVRQVAFAALLRGLDFPTHQLIQLNALAVCSRLENNAGTGELPMPIVNHAGEWAIHDIRDNVTLVMRLEMEALVFNLSHFFEAGGLSNAAGIAAPPQI